MHTDLMIDLETLATTSGAAILQIAAMPFEPCPATPIAAPGPIIDGVCFNAYVSDSAGDVDVQTVAWWLRQKGAGAMGERVASGLPEADVLREFASFVSSGGYARVWAHGATFDLPILEEAFRRHGIKTPWGYRAPRDTRTLYDLTPGGMPTFEVDETRKHDALYDCAVQVQQVQAALAKIRDGLNFCADEAAPIFVETAGA